MDLNRIKKNITNRDWGSKSKETNIKYIKQMLFKILRSAINVKIYLER